MERTTRRSTPDASPVRSSSTGDAPLKRSWTDATGELKLEATLLGIKEGKVARKRIDGSIVVVPLNNLSDADQTVVRELVSRTGS